MLWMKKEAYEDNQSISKTAQTHTKELPFSRSVTAFFVY